MKLSDGTIRKLLGTDDISIDPMPPDERLQPCSVDLALGTSFVWPYQGGKEHAIIAEQIVLPPGEFVLASTFERVRLSRSFMAQVHGKSSWARVGLLVEAAGLVDPGFDGRITLELFNMSARPLPLSAGKAICQITFERVDWPVVRPYGHPDLNSHYQGQLKATPGVMP